MGRLLRLALAICAPLMLASCLVTPGKFTSTLDIRADRSFTFTYQGEVLLLDTDDMEPSSSDDDKKDAATKKKEAAAKAQANAVKMREVADTLTKEQGYRSVKYMGENVFLVDYRASGRLDHGFIYPFNLDASMIVPFIAIELRGPDRVRIKAPGFANSEDSSSAMGMPAIPSADASKATERLDGRFTLTTDAEVVSQNQEDGVTTVPAGKSMSWKVTPKTETPPTVVLKLKPLP